MWWRRVRYLLLLTALCAIATCPSAKRACQANTSAQEAEDLIAYLADQAALVHASTGKLPAAPAGPTPTASCCDQGGTCSPDPTSWQAPAWRALSFSIDDAHRYTYAYVPDPGGMSAIIRATGDLDCDGQPALFEVKLEIKSGKLTRTVTRKQPRE